MLSRLLLIAAASASALRIGNVAVSQTTRAAVSMYDEKVPKVSTFELPSSVTRSRAAREAKVGPSIVVTDGTDSFFHSRTMVQSLYDFGDYGKITASSTSMADAKKMLISRTARYSGLLDVLDFHEGSTPDFTDADSWLSVNAKEATLSAEIDAAAAAGVKRAFILFTEPINSVAALDEQLKASGMEYTLLRTGSLVNGPAGTGLKLDAFEEVVCDDVSIQDIFRFVTEALTLPEAANRQFSLCPSDGVVPALKQMRLAGYERRDEVKAVLTDALPDDSADALALASKTPEEIEAEEQLVLRSEAEVAAEREEELKALLERARARGEETQKRLALEEAERLAYRKEQEKYYKSPSAADAPPDTPPPAAGDSSADKA